MEPEIKEGLLLDILPTNAPALSSTSDMPVIETKPDAIAEPPVVAEAAPEKAETPVESATTATEEQSGADDEEVKKPPRGVQKRLEELTRQREDAERRAERLLAIIESQKQPEAQAPSELVRPSRDDYSDPAQYEDAFMAYAVENAKLTAKKEVESMTRAAKEQAERNDMENRVRAAQESYAQRVKATKAKYADFSEVAESPDVQIPRDVAHAILAAEDGPELQYYLGKNPDEATRLMSLPVHLQLVELGKISTKLATPASKPALSNAPPPPKALKPGPAEVPIDPSNESMEAYVARRKKESAANARH